VSKAVKRDASNRSIAFLSGACKRAEERTGWMEGERKEERRRRSFACREREDEGMRREVREERRRCGGDEDRVWRTGLRRLCARMYFVRGVSFGGGLYEEEGKAPIKSPISSGG
jgi:hypothetical protein